MTPPKIEYGEDCCLVRVIHEKVVEDARKEALGARELMRLTGFFKALADPTRLSMVYAMRHREMCVCDLAAFLEISESAVSHQLRTLRELGLVKNRRDAQVFYYSLDDDHVEQLLAMGLEHIRH